MCVLVIIERLPLSIRMIMRICIPNVRHVIIIRINTLNVIIIMSIVIHVHVFLIIRTSSSLHYCSNMIIKPNITIIARITIVVLLML